MSLPTRLTASANTWRWPFRRGAPADLNGANFAAGLTAGLWYVVGGVPLHLDVSTQLKLSPEAASSWLFIICVTGAVSGLLLSWVHRQPLPITCTMPGWIFLATAGAQYSLPEIMGACFLAGVVIVTLGMLQLDQRIMLWLPLPIVMGMFAGALFGYATRVFERLGAETALVGITLAGYLAARAAGRTWLPPVGVAACAGLLFAGLTGDLRATGVAWAPPVIQPIWPTFSLDSLLALTLPLVVLTVGAGHVQGIGYLLSRGFQPPVTHLTFAVGIATMINALLGGHPASVARGSIPIVVADDAGPACHRYVANVIASVCLLLLGLSATIASSLLGIVPLSLVATLAGLAIMSALLDSFRVAITTDLPVGACFALVIAASPLSLLGLGSGLWALVGGVLVSLALERPALLKVWRAGSLPAPTPHECRLM